MGKTMHQVPLRYHPQLPVGRNYQWAPSHGSTIMCRMYVCLLNTQTPLPAAGGDAGHEGAAGVLDAASLVPPLVRWCCPVRVLGVPPTPAAAAAAAAAAVGVLVRLLLWKWWPLWWLLLLPAAPVLTSSPALPAAAAKLRGLHIVAPPAAAAAEAAVGVEEPERLETAP